MLVRTTSGGLINSERRKHPVLLEERDLALTEALVQIVDATLSVARWLSRVDAQLEAARVGCDVA